MADQDGLVQVGSETLLEESMAQDNTRQEDLSLRSDPEVALGAAVAVHGHPLHQIFPTEDRTIPVGSTPDRSGSAPPRPLDMSQMVEIISQALRGDMQTLRVQMQSMGINMENRMAVNMQMLNEGQEEMKAGLVKVQAKCKP